MTELSPAAQAMMDAFNREARPEPHHQREAIAAALRTAAHQMEFVQDVQRLFAIAAELDGIAEG